MDDKAAYWDSRFGAEGAIWGEAPSFATREAARIFRNEGAVRVYVPGCAYGRNSLFLAREGFAVSASDISGEAIRIAVENAKNSSCANIAYRQCDLFFDTTDTPFDALLSINLLHLFDTRQATQVLDLFANSLKLGGVLVLTVMSVNDHDFGKGDRIDDYTYEVKKGRPLRYYDEASLRSVFPQEFDIREIREIKEHENHGGKEHDHTMMFVVAERR
jgi:SAM-dependent methyltransferase